MSYLGRKFVIFLCVLVLLVGTVFVMYRCGYRAGLSEAPRHHYSVDVMNALKTSSEFRLYVDSLYLTAFRAHVDSVVRRDDIITMMGEWMDSHPGCQMKGERRVPVTKSQVEGLFFKERR